MHFEYIEVANIFSTMIATSMGLRTTKNHLLVDLGKHVIMTYQPFRFKDQKRIQIKNFLTKLNYTEIYR